MPSLPCRCGSSINLTTCPHPDGFKLLPESRRDDLVDAIEALYREATSEDEFVRKLHRLITPLDVPSPHLFQCQDCGRLAVLKCPSDPKVSQWYIPDPAEPSAPLRLRSLSKEVD